jgi:hypothetical protein
MSLLVDGIGPQRGHLERLGSPLSESARDIPHGSGDRRPSATIHRRQAPRGITHGSSPMVSAQSDCSQVLREAGAGIEIDRAVTL